MPQCSGCNGTIDQGNKNGSVPSARARFCTGCRAIHRAVGLKRMWTSKRVKKYNWTEQLDFHLRQNYHGGLRQRAKVIRELQRLTGWPRWQIKRRAAVLGLTLFPEGRKTWTQADLDILERFVGKLTAERIAIKLGRSVNSVAVKLKKMGISSAISNGYTIRGLEMCFGEDHHKIERWIANGWLED
jgi:hypothetical protein